MHKRENDYYFEQNLINTEIALSEYAVYTGINIINSIDGFAFSRGSRKKILARDNYQCVICGATDHLEAAHINHNRNNPNYNNPSNGRILCTEHHLEDHINRAGRNGLSKTHNNRAIKLLKMRKNEYDRNP